MVPSSQQYALNLQTGAIFALPGVVDPAGCGGNCGVVANALLEGVPLVTQISPTTPPASTPPTAPPGTVDSLPAPTTH
jgi:hypothetical protein